jgi:tetratricopeptide (TPR) repeat protein
MRVWTICTAAAIAILLVPNGFAGSAVVTRAHAAADSAKAPAHRLQTSLETQTPKSAPPAGKAGAPATATPPAAPPSAPLTDTEKANQLGDQVGKLMIKCMNLLSAQDPLALDYCKQQRDLADQYPGHLRMIDRVLAHDEYGIALAAFDRKQEALTEFNQEILLLPKALKPGTIEWSTAYWHRAMIYNQLGENERADHDYRAAEESFRKQERTQKGDVHADSKMKMVLHQHAALLKKEGKTAAAERLLAEAAK